MNSLYYNNLIQRVLDNSRSNNWKDAVYEWDIVDWEEDKTCNSSCICGKENIRYLYTIRNKYTKKCLYPIGSSCIEKFKRDDLNEKTAILERLFKLLSAIRDRERIELNSKFFSRKLLRYMYNEGAFLDNEYNDYDGYNDYLYMLDMFNKRDKSNINNAKQRKINAIIVSSIKPYLVYKLEENKGIY